MPNSHFQLWKTLGYEASKIELSEVLYPVHDRLLEMAFNLHVWEPCRIESALILYQSLRDYEASLLCPEGTCKRQMDSVLLHLRFSEDLRSNEDGGGSFLIPDPTNGQISTLQGSLVFPRSTGDVCRHQKTRSRSGLDKATIFTLLDAGFRSSIYSRPGSIAARVRVLAQQDSIRLSDIAPAIFVATYIQRLEEKTKLIPGISRWLAAFMESSNSVGRTQVVTDFFRFNSEIGTRINAKALPLQRDLWTTATNATRDLATARRLPPLWSSRNVNSEKTSLDPFATTDMRAVSDGEAATCETPDPWCSHASDDEEPDDNLFDLDLQFELQPSIWRRHISTVTLEGISDSLDTTAVDLHDVEIPGGGQGAEALNGLPAACEIVARRKDENSKSSNGLLRLSDLSMLAGPDLPIEEACLISQGSAIGGPAWLTQNVIRMHPLRQQQDERDVDHPRFPSRKESSLYQRHHLGRSEGDGASGVIVGQIWDWYTNRRPTDICSSPTTTSEQDLIQDSISFHYDSEEDDFIADRAVPMSKPLKQDTVDSSLADVLGNDHLLWHMWKRRASVAPRGEEDIVDMRMMYETDPDMKLLSGRWDLDPSDVSSGSNEDPMLQETMTMRSPHRETHSQPITPNSERRSYFPSTRSSSSSSYVGRSSSDPKRRSSLIKRFTWGGRNNAAEAPRLDMSKINNRTMEVKRRKTMDDYEMMDREENEDDSNEMLF